jgi:large subunit ribosomal protein L9
MLSFACKRLFSAVTSSAASSGTSNFTRTFVRKGHRVSVILRERLDNLGFAGEEVEVAPGYARNFLVPKGSAVYATDSNRARFRVVMSEEEARRAGEERAESMLRKRVSAVTLTFKRASTDGTALYAPVTAADVAEGLAATPLKNMRVREANVRLPPGQLKEVGEHVVHIAPAATPDVWCPLQVNIESS